MRQVENSDLSHVKLESYLAKKLHTNKTTISKGSRIQLFNDVVINDFDNKNNSLQLPPFGGGLERYTQELHIHKQVNSHK